MLSNKLTFSLASLIVLIAFGFVFTIAPVMAQTPTVESTGPRSAQVMTLTFSGAVAEVSGGPGVTWAYDSTPGSINNLSFGAAAGELTASGKTLTITLDFTSGTPADATKVVMSFPTGSISIGGTATTALIQANIALQPVETVTLEIKPATGDETIINGFDVLLKFSGPPSSSTDIGSTTSATAIAAAGTVIKAMTSPSTVAAPTISAVAAEPTGSTTTFKVTYDAPSAGAESVTISVKEDYIKAPSAFTTGYSKSVAIGLTGTGIGTAPSAGTGTASRTDMVVTIPLTATQVAAGHHIILANNYVAAQIALPTSTDDYSIFTVTNMLPDLSDFFRYGGGTIDLAGPGTTDKRIIISEIMWGSNEGADPGTAANKASQWIELFSTVATATAGDWTLTFTSNKLPSAKPTGLSDRLTTYPELAASWDVDDGDHGHGGSDVIKNSDGVVVQAAKAYRSMVRNINFVDYDANATEVKGVSGGAAAGDWLASTKRGSNQSGDRYATPGERSQEATAKISAKTEIDVNKIVINEVGNRTDNKNDWIELYNMQDKIQDIDGWILTLVTAAGEEKILVEFDGRNDDVDIPAGVDSNGDPTDEGYLVVVNTDPAKTGLAVGEDVTGIRSTPRGVKTLYYIAKDLEIPNEGSFLLILRDHDGKGKIEDTDVSNDHEKIVDIAGNANFGSSAGKYNTKAWPLHAHPGFFKQAADLGATNANSWVRNANPNLINHDDVWKTAGYTGLGYDRNADPNSGSPGYANGNKEDGIYREIGTKDVLVGDLSISEIMYHASDPPGKPEANIRRALPQWIELYNSSETHSINLDGWRLEITNTDREGLGGTRHGVLKLVGGYIVPPNQTVLLVSTTASRVSVLDRSNDFFPENRVYDLFEHHADDLDMTDRRDTILSRKGFMITLMNPKDEARAQKVYSDVVGNLDDKDNVAWALPEAGEHRSSIVRVYTGDGAPDDGTAQDGWRSAAMLETYNSDGTYYGDADDIGSPGWREGGALPVSLSSFRPVRDKATGEVVIRWVTESELNNAGFNILRSETKRGDFKVVNLKGIIPGHGTTSEKHVYTWTDTSAKPNVVYYYQIEDVSLDGDRTTLRTTHLRGNVNAAGKLTTRWGELKTYGK